MRMFYSDSNYIVNLSGSRHVVKLIEIKILWLAVMKAMVAAVLLLLMCLYRRQFLAWAKLPLSLLVFLSRQGNFWP